MQRRPFIKQILMAAPLAHPQAWRGTARRRIKPPRLREGDRVGLIAPGGPLSEAKIDLALRQIEQLGLRPELGAHVRARHGFTAGTDAERLADLHWAFGSPDLRAVWCIRGGYGCGRLLPQLDMRLIRRHPKILIGFSDVTALLLAIEQATGLVTFHGPTAAWPFSEANVADLRAVLMEGRAPLLIGPDEHTQSLLGGQAKGELAGGNLSLLAALSGTPYAAALKDKILFLEDVGEKPYRIDRMLTQLRQNGSLRQVRGIVLGEFSDCEAEPGDASHSLLETLRHNLGDLGVPLLHGFPFGHVERLCTLPLGIPAELDADARTLRLLESAVA